MRLIIIGLSHKTAPIEVREQVTIPEELLPEANRRFHEESGSGETMILSTCNRIEAYLFGADKEGARDKTIKFLLDFSHSGLTDLDRYTYSLDGEEAVEHLFKVASGLDSMVIGEAQVTGQLKAAYAIARQEETTGRDLNRLMSYALFTAKKIRSDTKISELPVSVSSVAVELAKKIFEDLSQRKVLLIGAGKMSRLAARGFLSSGIQKLHIINRTYEKACLMSEELGGQVYSYDQMENCLVSSDIVIVSTGAREFILGPELLGRVIKQRKNQPLFIIDITVPRNVDPAVNQVDNIFLYDIDNLSSVIGSHMETRLTESEAAHRIISEEVNGYLHFSRQRELGPLVRSLREKVEEICREELQCTRDNMSEEEYEKMRKIMFRTVNRLSHPLIQQIKSSADEYPELLNSRDFLENLVKDAFELEEKE